MSEVFALLVFPGGLFVLVNSVFYEWIDRKMVARLHNRIGPRWFQPFADVLKLLTKEDVEPEGASRMLFNALPVLAIAGALTAALFVPIAGMPPVMRFPGDLIVAVYLLSLLSLSLGVAGTNTGGNPSIVGATRILTQLVAYEAPFLMALLGPAFAAGSWEVAEIMANNGGQWMLLSQPIGFVIILMSLMGKLEMPPFDAPEAETEIVAGALTEYGGTSLALFILAKKVVLLVGLTLTAALYMGGIVNPLDYAVKTIALLLMMAFIRAALTRFRIDQTITLWWRYMVLLMLAQWAILLLQEM